MFDEIVNRYYSVILNYCKYKLNGNKSAAEDVTQEVFLTLYQKINRLKLSENIKFWLYRTADNKVKSYIRKNPSFLPIEDCLEITQKDDYPSLSESDFDCLSGEEKDLLIDYYSDGSRENIAKAHNLNMNALYIRIHKIKKKLADKSSKNNKIKI
ncbi:MAG: sigma-70 family RNA polymerase sigma factor [Ruminococcus flavefaciens]|nr:sigma-70 family RNA polymerase sigma factor [Ruminococcus flavefaciens]MCM1059273.1 sigma-70 family RNA polymerase sigma factor [Eubacterium sp.]